MGSQTQSFLISSTASVMQYPLSVRLLLLFLLAALTYNSFFFLHYHSKNEIFINIILLFALFSSVLLIYFYYKKSNNRLFSLITGISFTSIFLIYFFLSDIHYKNTKILNQYTDKDTLPLFICVNEKVKTSNHYKIFECSIIRISDYNYPPLRGKVRLFLKKSEAEPIRGEVFRIITLKKNFLYFPSPDKNPDDVHRDAVHDIICTAWLDDTNCHKTNFFIPRYDDIFYHWKEKITHFIKQRISNNDVSSLAAAMLIGSTDEISSEIIEDFSKTGVIHILSVSGLHVGLIYLILIFFIQRFNLSFPVRLIILTCVLFLYAFICGMKPPVWRAVIMCLSLECLRKLPYSSEPAGLHVLVFCAFLFLLMNPFLLFDLSFQLSFASMSGLLVVFPVLKNKISEYNLMPAMKWLTDNFLVTFSTSLTTLPFILITFHSFTFMSFLSNLILVPLSFVFMVSLGLLVIPYSFIHQIPSLIGVFLLKTMNFLSGYSDIFIFRNVYFNRVDFILSVLVIMAIILTLYHKEFLYLKFSLMLIVCWMIISLLDVWKAKQSVFLAAGVQNNEPVILIKNRNRMYMNTNNTNIRSFQNLISSSAYPDISITPIYSVIDEDKNSFWFYPNKTDNRIFTSDSSFIFTYTKKDFLKYTEKKNVCNNLIPVFIRKNQPYIKKYYE